MRNIAPVVSTLDNFLRQSLDAAACSAKKEDETLARLNAIFDRIARFYCTTIDVICQCVIEPSSTAVELDGGTLRCPPISSDVIILDIVHGSEAMRSSQFIQWTRGGGWCTAGIDLDREGHATLLRNALYESDLFASTTMTLEPLACREEANR
jgi:hypothetical protein